MQGGYLTTTSLNVKENFRFLTEPPLEQGGTIFQPWAMPRSICAGGSGILQSVAPASIILLRPVEVETDKSGCGGHP